MHFTCFHCKFVDCNQSVDNFHFIYEKLVQFMGKMVILFWNLWNYCETYKIKSFFYVMKKPSSSYVHCSHHYINSRYHYDVLSNYVHILLNNLLSAFIIFYMNNFRMKKNLLILILKGVPRNFLPSSAIEYIKCVAMLYPLTL